ncbi:hypothetical protein QUB36_13535 [Microcoleus sp. AT8-B1]|uniref:hypothetical protein n=1 Tax=unclassified Microcoleus TaxID=2642155 RepID=UPI002FD1C416
MAALAPGSITSTTVEDALLEILRKVADLQSSTTTNPQNRILITSFTQNELTGLFSVSLSVPSTITYDETAGLVASATEVFV